jgi:hypothetical protein
MLQRQEETEQAMNGAGAEYIMKILCVCVCVCVNEWEIASGMQIDGCC